jgi:hypothetical protein
MRNCIGFIREPDAFLFSPDLIDVLIDPIKVNKRVLLCYVCYGYWNEVIEPFTTVTAHYHTLARIRTNEYFLTINLKKVKLTL